MGAKKISRNLIVHLFLSGITKMPKSLHQDVYLQPKQHPASADDIKMKGTPTQPQGCTVETTPYSTGDL